MSTTASGTAEERNPRGIPRAPFIADIEEYVGGLDGAVEVHLREFQAAIAKYRYMDHNLTQRRQTLEEKIPDIKKTLAMVEFLQERHDSKSRPGPDAEADDDLDELGEEKGLQEPIKTTFELNDTLFAEAVLEDTDTVYIWLGANVMLAYKIPVAIELLKSKLDNAQTSLKNTMEDLEYLREQLTIMEVNTARMYNWDVKRRRELRKKGTPTSKDED